MNVSVCFPNHFQKCNHDCELFKGDIWSKIGMVEGMTVNIVLLISVGPCPLQTNSSPCSNKNIGYFFCGCFWLVSAFVSSISGMADIIVIVTIKSCLILNRKEKTESIAQKHLKIRNIKNKSKNIKCSYVCHLSHLTWPMNHFLHLHWLFLIFPFFWSLKDVVWWLNAT